MARRNLTFKDFFKQKPIFVASFPEPEIINCNSGGNEIAFLGRSNVGKSSLINAIANQKSLAKTSSTPGRTQMLNFFAYDDAGTGVEKADKFLVDLPGYGFAKAPKKIVDKWNENTKNYLLGRAELKRVLLLIDSRHGIKPVDEKVMKMFDECGVNYQIIMTKADKVSTKEVERKLSAIQAITDKHPALHPEVLVSSSEKGIGLDDVRKSIYEVLHL